MAKGPAKDVALYESRFTCGVTSTGKIFEVYDDWTRPDRRHLVLEEPWLGYTVFVERGFSNLDFQKTRGCAITPAKGRWADAD